MLKCFDGKCYQQQKSNKEDYSVLAQHIYDSFLIKYLDKDGEGIELKYESFGRNAYKFQNKKHGILFYIEMQDRVIVCENQKMVKRIKKILGWK